MQAYIQTDMPDYPDDIPHDIDLSMFKGGAIKPGFMHHFLARAGDDGLTFYEREEQERQKINDQVDKINEATVLRDFESVTLPCVHLQECLGECRESIENKRIAEEKYQKTMAALSGNSKPPNKAPKKTVQGKGPSTLTSTSAATALSQAKRTDANPPSKPHTKYSISTKPTSILPRSKKTPQPTNPSNMRHNAATATSKTTIGHSKGRATSAAIRKTSALSKDGSKFLNAPDINLAPDLYIERYGVPRFGSEQWIRCKQAGCFDDQAIDMIEAVGGSVSPHDDWLLEEAERDFQLIW